jgi:hypothetical protein
MTMAMMKIIPHQHALEERVMSGAGEVNRLMASTPRQERNRRSRIQTRGKGREREGEDAHNHEKEHDDVPKSDEHPKKPEVAQKVEELALETVGGFLKGVLF